jgi:hypothetical protein
MNTVVGLLKASHFGPTLIVTTIGFLFGTYYWWEGPAYVIAFGIFCGQLIVGWTNDLYDYQDDLSHNRTKKPLRLTRPFGKPVHVPTGKEKVSQVPSEWLEFQE